MRICSLLPSATEIAFALGLGDSVVAVSHECDYPPEARKKTVVIKSAIDSERTNSREIDREVSSRLRAGQGIYTIDMERLRKADPDLILTQELCDVCAVDYSDVVKAAHTLPRSPKVLSLDPNILSDVLKDIERVGRVAGKEDEARALVRGLKGRIDQVRERACASTSKPRVACLEWLDPIYSGGHWIPEMVEIAGGMTTLGEKGKPSARIDWNEVVQFSPEVIVLMPCGFDARRTLTDAALLFTLPAWNDLPAVKEERVFAVNGHAYFSRSGPRLVDGLEILAQIIHPEIFPWEAPPEAALRL